ncbi:decarboxylating NADP(+)-dependent phosphogluconate dehydrogenase [Buchnera aphidicola (Kurisakia onigurumii)]|uniref:decarboxylating NADP(+)-dependent phosphogluconate dehydrogenase n=1 Tax=Buchnera aphidicola TaxID=9 RepID=UPI0031B6B82A
MLKKQVGVIGMAVMGYNLALNIESKGYLVSIFNRSHEKTKEIISKNQEKKIFPYFNLKEFIFSLEKPRKVLLMIQAGCAIDNVINSILPYLEKGDVVIDGGNSFYQDTIIRNRYLEKKGIYFIGAGISGGEEGALKGPCIMPGGSRKGYFIIESLFKNISAKINNQSCVDYIGENGSGHYVKMIHNGIEYGDMQLISESYSFLKNILNCNNIEISNIFSDWNKGELNSYLIEITKNIFNKKDNKGNYIIDSILDEASSKGTGKWVSQNSLELEEPLSLITESVFARYISNMKNQRIIANKKLNGPYIKKNNFVKKELIEKIRQALYLGKIISYAQGFSLLRKASEKYNWKLNFQSIASIFRSGCIIRASLLDKISEEYENNKNLLNLLITPYFSKISNLYHISLRDIVSLSVIHGISVPAFCSAISYYDGYRSINSNANLIQAQRDYFGSHTYKRIDQIGSFHTQWV